MFQNFNLTINPNLASAHFISNYLNRIHFLRPSHNLISSLIHLDPGEDEKYTEIKIVRFNYKDKDIQNGQSRIVCLHK